MAEGDQRGTCAASDVFTNAIRQFARVAFLFAYLSVGALIFREIENDSMESCDEQGASRLIQQQTRQELGLLTNSTVNSTIMLELLKDIGRVWNGDKLERWELIDGLKFCWATVTTIGYGNIVPISDNGKIAFICYSCIGIPLCFYVIAAASIVLTDIAKRFVSLIELRLLQRRRVEHMKRKAVAFSIVSFIAQLFSMAVYYNAEEASFTDGIYYWFATYTTIGFGDLQDNHTVAENPWFFVVACWFHLFGLGTLASIFQLGNKKLTKAGVRTQREAFQSLSSYISRRRLANSERNGTGVSVYHLSDGLSGRSSDPHYHRRHADHNGF